MSDLKYKIRVKIGDREIEIVGPKEYVDLKYTELKEEILNFDMPVPNRVTSQQDTVSESTIEIPDNLPTFLSMKGNPPGKQDIALVFAEWLLIKESIDPFNRTDISNCFKLTRIPPSKNIAVDLIRLQAKGYLIPDEKEGGLAYRISKTGIDYLKQMEK